MNSEEATAMVIDALEALDVPYILVGSLASNFYGVPRATQDADFVVQVEQDGVRDIVQRLGSRFRLVPQTSFEMVTATTRYIVEAVDVPFQIELFLLSEDPHDQERFLRRRTVKLMDRQTFVLTAEDTVITKLRWSRHGNRTKDIEDVRGVIAVQSDRIQWDYVETWCERHDTRDLLDEIRRSI